MPVLRLDKIISELGLGSRREIKSFIKAGRIAVNGETAACADMKCDTDADKIHFDGRLLCYEKFVYLMMNKPADYLSATEDDEDMTVLELLDGHYVRLKLFPVGRLDKDTEGLLLLTNDGDFSHRVISPKKGIVKTYYVEVDNPFSDDAVAEFKAGIILGDGTSCLPAELEILSSGRISTALLGISEGKYHQVKRMMAKTGNPVRYLKRISIGGLKLDEALMPGQYRLLNNCERLLIFDDNLH